LIILNYHRVAEGDLRSHLLYLRRHYRILPLEAALEELYRPRKGSGRKVNRCSALALTFDDGYHDNYTHGFALMRELEIPFTLFLIPGYIESGNYFWWQEGKRLVTRAQVKEATIEGSTYHLDQIKERAVLVQIIDRHARFATSVAEREGFLESVRKVLAVPASLVPEEVTTLPLTWAEVHEMEESGWASFGVHTLHHPILAYLADPAEVQREVLESRTLLERHLGHPVCTFAYPVGQVQHIGEEVIRAVKHAGYDWALTTIYGFNTPRSDAYLLRRIEVDVSQHWLVIAAEAAGLWGFFSWLRWVPFIREHFTGSSLK